MLISAGTAAQAGTGSRAAVWIKTPRRSPLLITIDGASERPYFLNACCAAVLRLPNEAPHWALYASHYYRLPAQ